jgi:CRP-like cAMP-binding protein
MDVTYSTDTILSLRSDAPCLSFRPREFLARRNETPRAIWLIEEGWAARFKLLRDGRRHISRFYAPGDLCDLSWLVTKAADQSIVALALADGRPRRSRRNALAGRMAYHARLQVGMRENRPLSVRALFAP